MTKPRRNPRKARGSRPRKPSDADYDSPWKEALDRYFDPCMAFFFPIAHAEIDWGRGYEMLDKELQPIVREAATGRRYVDKLVKVWLKSGEERWVLIHIEVQGSREGAFPRRMHVYNHRIFDRYNREVISLAILADDDPSWRPDRYEYARWGFRSLTEFPVVKIQDYAPECEELETDPNPFSVVVLAQLKATETRRSPAERHTWKVRLVKGLYERGLDPEDVRRLFAFIDWVLELPESLVPVFWDEIDAYQQEKAMPYLGTLDKMAMQMGLLQGIEACLKIKFGDEGLELLPEIHEIRDHIALGKVLKRIETAESPAALRRYCARIRRPKKAEPM